MLRNRAPYHLSARTLCETVQRVTRYLVTLSFEQLTDLLLNALVRLLENVVDACDALRTFQTRRQTGELRSLERSCAGDPMEFRQYFYCEHSTTKRSTSSSGNWSTICIVSNYLSQSAYLLFKVSLPVCPSR